MVGVPGRSKGCETCLKRRVKCDEEKPSCRRCIKAGYQCAGYERKLEIREHTYAKVGNEHRQYVSRPPPRATANQQSLVFHLNPAPTEPSDPAATVPESLSLVAFKDEMQFSFVIDNSVWRTYGSPWLELSAQGKLGQLALDSCMSFAQTVFGQHYHQPEIELQGMSLYGRTVSILSRELDRIPHSARSEKLITPILLLLMYATAKADRQASYVHVVGLNKVLQSGHPSSFAKMPYRLAFESARSTLFTVALVTKQRCFLSQSAWKTEPWTGARKTAQNELVDILVNLPGYLSDLALVQQGVLLEDLLIVAIEADLDALEQWRWRWQIENPHAAWEVATRSLSPETTLSTMRIGHDVLWFRTFSQSTELLLFNAVLICMLGVLAYLSPRNYTVTSPLQGVLSSHALCQQPSVHIAAIEICRAFEYQLINIRGSRDTSFFWLLPLGIAGKILQHDTEYKPWVDDMLATSNKLKSHGSDSTEFAFGYWSFLDKAASQINTLNLW